MNRLTPEIVENMLERHPNWRLGSGSYDNCALALAYFDKTGKLPTGFFLKWLTIGAELELSPYYTLGFLSGYDERPLQQPNDKEFNLGLEDGHAVRHHFNVR